MSDNKTLQLVLETVLDVKKVLAEHDKRFDEIDNKLDEHGGLLLQLDEKIDHVDAKVDRIVKNKYSIGTPV